MKRALLIATAVIALSHASLAKEGSGGVTGGSDDVIAVEQLLPRSLRIKALFPWPERLAPVAVGRKTKFGVSERTVWAQALGARLSFDRALLIQQLISVDGTVSFGTVQGFTGVATGLQVPIRLSEKDFAEHFRNLETACFACERSDAAVYIEWEGTKISRAELVSRLTERAQILVNQLTPLDLASIKQLQIFNEILRRLNLNDLIREESLLLHIDPRPRNYTALEATYVELIRRSLLKDLDATEWRSFRNVRFSVTQWSDEWRASLGREAPGAANLDTEEIVVRAAEYDLVTLKLLLFHELAHLADPARTLKPRPAHFAFHNEKRAWEQTLSYAARLERSGVRLPIRFANIRANIAQIGLDSWIKKILESRSRTDLSH